MIDESRASRCGLVIARGRHAPFSRDSVVQRGGNLRGDRASCSACLRGRSRAAAAADAPSIGRTVWLAAMVVVIGSALRRFAVCRHRVRRERRIAPRARCRPRVHETRNPAQFPLPVWVGHDSWKMWNSRLARSARSHVGGAPRPATVPGFSSHVVPPFTVACRSTLAACECPQQTTS